MSAQADQVVGSARELAAMAAQLDQLVARFRLEGDVGAAGWSGTPGARAAGGTVVPRRRSDDWGRAA